MDADIDPADLHGIRARLEGLAEETGDEPFDLAVAEIIRTRQSLRQQRAVMRQAGLDVRGVI